MKFPLAYYLMLLYVTVMFKPLISVISDAYSHTFGEAIHLATIHAKFGSNHLQRSLATTGTENNNKNQKSFSTSEDSPVHVRALECRYEYRPDRICNNYRFPAVHKPSSIFLKTLVPPPKC